MSRQVTERPIQIELAPTKSRFALYLALIRPKHWIKNWFVLAPLIFSNSLRQPNLLLNALLAVASFSLCASSVYCLNDVFDLDKDRCHPDKRDRPLASGAVSVGEALALSAIMAVSGLALAYSVKWQLGAIELFYLLMFAGYSYAMKHWVLLDVLIIAAGFMLRVFAGGVVIGVSVSHWLLLCTILLATFLGLGKRRNELLILGTDAGAHRQILDDYSTGLIDQLILISATLTLASYALYTVAPETVSRFHTDKLIFTFPIVLYGVFRYLYLVHIKGQGEPVAIVFNDRPILIAVLMWFLSVLTVIYLRL